MKRALLILLLLAVPTALPAQTPDFIWFTVETPVDPMTGTYVLPWTIEEYDGSTFNHPVFSIPGEAPVSALHKMDAMDAWLVSLTLPSSGPLPPSFVEQRDILRYVPGVGYSLFFCGASAIPPLPPNADVDALYLDGGDGGDLVLSVDVPVEVAPGVLGLPPDLLKYTRSGPGCAGWTYSGKVFDSTAPGLGVPPSANIVGAESVDGEILFTVDSPTALTPSASMPAIYQPREIISWDGAMFDRAFAPGSDPFPGAFPPSTVLNGLASSGSAAAVAPAGSDMILVTDSYYDEMDLLMVTDVSTGTATSKVVPTWPPPWMPPFQARIAGPVAVSDDFSRIYIMMDGEYHIQGIEPATGAVVDTFISAVHGDGMDFEYDAADRILYTTTSLGEIVAVDLMPGPSFGQMTTLATGLNHPMGIDVESTGTYAYVAEHGAGRIVMVELATGTVTPVATVASPPGDVSILDAIYTLGVITDGGDLVLVDGDMMSPGFGTVTPVLSGLGGPTSVNIGSSGIDGVIVTEGATGKVLSLNANPMSPGFGTSLTLASGLGAPGGAGLILIPGFVMLPCVAAPATGSTISSCAYAATGAAELGGYGATLSWDPSALSFSAWTAGEPPFDTPVVNTTSAASGMLSFSAAAAAGAAGTTHLLCAEFDVIGPRTGPGQTTSLDLTMTSAYDTGLSSLLPGAVTVDSPVDITAACTIGDPVADMSTNSGDALAILRREVGLSVPAAVENLLQARCGDLNDDGLTDSTDSNVALTLEVGLPVEPSFPIGQSNVVTLTCAGGPCSGQPVPAAAPGGFGSLEGAGKEALSAGPVVARLRVESKRKILPGDSFDLIVELETGTLTVGSFAGALSWDTEDALMRSVAAGQSQVLGTPTINDSEAAAGKFRFAAASPRGASGTVELLRMTLTARHALPKPGRVFTLEFGSMAATGPGFESLLPVLEIAAPADRKGRP